MKRTSICVILAVVVGVLTCSPPAGAAPSDSEPTQSMGIAGTPVSLEVPAHWENLGHFPGGGFDAGLRGWQKQFPNVASVFGLSDAEFVRFAKKDLKFVALVAADTNHDGAGDGDNVMAKLYTDGQEFDSLTEWKYAQRLSAKATKSKVLSDSQGRAGKYPTFTHMELYPDGVVFAAMEIDLPGKRYVDVFVTLDPGSEHVAKQILDSAHG